jgi:hypothetical protein
VAKELRSAIDRGEDPESYNRERQIVRNCESQKLEPVEILMRFIAGDQQSEPLITDLIE